jgi:hypothetical protein
VLRSRSRPAVAGRGVRLLELVAERAAVVDVGGDQHGRVERLEVGRSRLAALRDRVRLDRRDAVVAGREHYPVAGHVERPRPGRLVGIDEHKRDDQEDREDADGGAADQEYAVARILPLLLLAQYAGRFAGCLSGAGLW